MTRDAPAAGFTAVALFARNDDTRSGLAGAVQRRGLELIEVTADPRSFVDVVAPGVAVRVPGGLAARAIRAGASLRLQGPTPQWFAGLDPSIGRRWHLVDADRAIKLLDNGTAFVKLADAKHPLFPAARFIDPGSFEAALTRLDAGRGVQLLLSTDWWDIDSEYRVFTAGRNALTVSPYRVLDEPWSPLLHTSRASFHREAQAFAAEVLAELSDENVPPAAVLDVARLASGRFALLEANQAWGSGLYGCDPDQALVAILAANAPWDERWRWRPDPSIKYW